MSEHISDTLFDMMGEIQERLDKQAEERADIAKTDTLASGALLVEAMPKHEGGRPRKTGNTVLPVSPETYEELGLTKMQADPGAVIQHQHDAHRLVHLRALHHGHADHRSRVFRAIQGYHQRTGRRRRTSKRSRSTVRS